jgi:hypothetical protein
VISWRNKNPLSGSESKLDLAVNGFSEPLHRVMRSAKRVSSSLLLLFIALKPCQLVSTRADRDFHRSWLVCCFSTQANPALTHLHSDLSLFSAVSSAFFLIIIRAAFLMLLSLSLLNRSKRSGNSATQLMESLQKSFWETNVNWVFMKPKAIMMSEEYDFGVLYVREKSEPGNRFM